MDFLNPANSFLTAVNTQGDFLKGEIGAKWGLGIVGIACY